MSVVVLVGSTGIAHADTGSPLDPVIKQLTDAVQGGAQQLQDQAQQNAPSAPAQQQANQPSQDAPDPPASDSDSPGNETTNPKAPDHSSSSVIKGGVTGQPQASGEGGSGTSTINDDGSSKADATLLALGGMELYGSHASSSGNTSSSGMASPVCTSSGGAVCPFQADAKASQNAAGSDSSTKTSAASLCLEPPRGLTFPPPSTSAGCTGGLGIEAVSSESTMHRDAATGETRGSTKSSLASVCAPTASTIPIPVPVPADPCIKAMGSEGAADSNGTATRNSSVADIFGMSAPLSQPNGTPAQLCNPAPAVTLLCGYVNQGETYLAPGLAGVSQTALQGNLLGLATLQLGHSEVLAHTAGAPAVVSPPVVAPPVVSGPVSQPVKQHKSVAAAVTGVLPHTGGIWSGWLAIGLLALAFGCAMTAWDIRRGRVAAAG